MIDKNSNTSFNICKQILEQKRKSTFTRTQKIFSYIDVLSAMTKFDYTALKSIYNIVLNDYNKLNGMPQFNIIKIVNKKIIFELNGLHGMKIEIKLFNVNPHIIFSFTSRYLRRCTTSADIVKDLQLFFKIVDHEISDTEIKDCLTTYSFEATIDMIGKSYFHTFEGLLSKVNKDIIMRLRTSTRTPRIAINKYTTRKYNKISHKLDPLYFEDALSTDGSAFIFYNKLSDIIIDAENGKHWWRHYSSMLNLNNDELELLLVNINFLNGNERQELFDIMNKNLHAITRAEYKINHGYLRKLLRYKKSPMPKIFNTAINILDFKEELLLYLIDNIYNFSVINTSTGKFNRHQVFAEMVETLVRVRDHNDNTGVKPHIPPVEYHDEQLKLQLQTRKTVTQVRNLQRKDINVMDLL